MKSMSIDEIKKKVSNFRKMRKEYDKIYKAIYASGRIKPAMRFLEKIVVLSKFEKTLTEIEPIKINEDKIRKEYSVHPKLNCPDLKAADEMYKEIIRVKDEGDSTGGVVEVVATGLPAGVGEPVFNKLDGELGRLLNINAVKAVEIGVGTKVKDMTGSECNDEMFSEKGKVKFKSNNAGGITGGLTTGEPVIVSITLKPTPTIAKDQHTIDKLTLKNAALKAVTRRDPSIVPRAWPVAEAFTSIIILDYYMQHLAYQRMINNKSA